VQSSQPDATSTTDNGPYLGRDCAFGQFRTAWQHWQKILIFAYLLNTALSDISIIILVEIPASVCALFSAPVSTYGCLVADARHSPSIAIAPAFWARLSMRQKVLPKSFQLRPIPTPRLASFRGHRSWKYMDPEFPSHHAAAFISNPNDKLAGQGRHERDIFERGRRKSRKQFTSVQTPRRLRLDDKRSSR
jgi:hypothetical protein